MYGRHGGKLHEDAFNLIRFDVAKRIYNEGWNALFIGDDGLMLDYLGEGKIHEPFNQRIKGARLPDLLVVDEHDNYIVYEIGNYNPEKWSCQVIHIGFSGKVTLINSNDSLFTKSLYNATAEVIEPPPPHTALDK